MYSASINTLKTAVIYITLLFCVFCSSYSAANSNIHQVCKQSPNLCIVQIDDELNKALPQSRLWFNLMLYKLDALFNLKQTSRLYEETKVWVDQEDTPIPFQITVYIYYLKSLPLESSKDKQQKYLKKAKEKLALLNDIYPNPLKLVELANLNINYGDIEEAYLSLHALSKTYARRNDPQFQMELYGNLGHAAHMSGRTDEGIQHWFTAIEWAREFGNLQQIATCYYNLSMTQMADNQLNQASDNFDKAIEYGAIAEDKLLIGKSKLFLVKTKINQKKLAQAKALFKTIHQHDIHSSFLKTYYKLDALIQKLDK